MDPEVMLDAMLEICFQTDPDSEERRNALNKLSDAVKSKEMLEPKKSDSN